MSFSFYPQHEHNCPNVRHCPHLGGAALGTLVLLANGESKRFLTPFAHLLTPFAHLRPERYDPKYQPKRGSREKAYPLAIPTQAQMEAALRAIENKLPLVNRQVEGLPNAVFPSGR